MIPPFHCVWNPESPRAQGFRQALGMEPGVTSWEDWLAGERPEVQPGTVIRIDSAGRNWLVEKALLTHGAEEAATESWQRLNPEGLGRLEEDRGRILASRQKYLGFLRALWEMKAHFRGGPWMQHPAEIGIMCDKAECQARLNAMGVRIPPVLGVVSGFDELSERMDAAKRNRVFLKLCHGSSSSGAVALERATGRLQAFSSARMSELEGETLLHNCRKVTRYENTDEIRRLVDAVCRQRAQAEVWCPKASWGDRCFDVRVVVIAGKARHLVARLAKSPFTNLQLGAIRGTAEDLRAHIGLAAYDAMGQEAERAMACFPRSLYGGVDIVLEPGRYRPRVLEVNAFGDLLPGLLLEGRDTYAWEIDQVSRIGA